MKTKGISIWEQHIERIVLGLAVLVFLGFAAMQFIGEPNAVEVAGTTFTPGTVDEALREQANGLQPRLAPGARSEIEFSDVATVSSRFDDALTASVAPDATVAPFQVKMAMADAGVAVAKGKPFVVPELPSPSPVAARQYFDAVVPEIVAEFGDLQPYAATDTGDLDWVTVAGVLDLARVLAAFDAEGPDGTPARIPPSWYNEKVSILDVVLEREELVDGNWTDRTVVNPLPGQFTVRPQLESEVDAPARDVILGQVNDEAFRSQIVQPEFYATKNASWTAPDPRDAEGDDLARIDEADEQTLRIASMTKQLKQKRTRRDEVAAKLQEVGGRLGPGDSGRRDEGGGDAKKPPSGRQAPGSGGGTLSGGGAGRRSGGGPTRQEQEETNRLRQRLTRQLDQLDDQISRIERELEQLGQQVVREEAEADADAVPGEMLVWGHDLDIEPGRVYRYRLTVELYNPFFARRHHLVEEQHHLATSITMSTPASDWTQPVEIQPPLRVFITRANAMGQRGGDLGMGAAMAEVFRFHDGRWWVERFAVQPGDRIGAVKEPPRRRGEGEQQSLPSIDFGTDWFLLDVVEHADASGQSITEGRGAWVLLQNLRTGALSGMRDPRLESRAPERQRLREEVDLAEL